MYILLKVMASWIHIFLHGLVSRSCKHIGIKIQRVFSLWIKTARSSLVPSKTTIQNGVTCSHSAQSPAIQPTGGPHYNGAERK